MRMDLVRDSMIRLRRCKFIPRIRQHHNFLAGGEASIYARLSSPHSTYSRWGSLWRPHGGQSFISASACSDCHSRNTIIIDGRLVFLKMGYTITVKQWQRAPLRSTEHFYGPPKNSCFSNFLFVGTPKVIVHIPRNPCLRKRKNVQRDGC